MLRAASHRKIGSPREAHELSFSAFPTLLSVYEQDCHRVVCAGICINNQSRAVSRTDRSRLWSQAEPAQMPLDSVAYS